MISGSPAEAGEALREIAGPPPANTAADRFPMGVFAADELVGYLGLLRDYPDMKDWWVGLLLLDPRERGSGLGARIYRAASRWTADLGGRSHGLGVVEENVAGKRFWERNGFRESRRESYRVGAKEHTLIVMRRRLGGGRAGAQEHL